MPLTFSGRNIKADNTDHPSLLDIAVGLSRQPRFGGQTRRWWSVLDHTLFGDELAKAEGYDRAERELRLAWLLHDAHEALMGDVPTPYKGAELRALQQGLDVRIYDAYFPGGYALSHWLIPELKIIDGRTLRAEAMLVGPPQSENRPSAFGIDAENSVEVKQDMDELRRMLGRGVVGIPPVTFPATPESHPSVQDFLHRIMELI